MFLFYGNESGQQRWDEVCEGHVKEGKGEAGMVQCLKGKGTIGLE
jgi:hypothetical protein